MVWIRYYNYQGEILTLVVRRNIVKKIAIAAIVMLAAGLGYLMIRLIIWIISHWRYIGCWSFFTIIFLAAAFFIFRAVKGKEDSPRTRREAWLTAGIVFCLLECPNFQSTFFHYHIEKLEQQFIDVALTAPWEITDNQQLDYYGKLDEIIFQKNQLLRRYHYRDAGEW